MPVASMSILPRTRHGPGVGDAGKFHRGVEFGDQLLLRNPARPLLARLQHHDGFEHRERRRIRGCIGPAGLAQHVGYLRLALQTGVGELQQPLCLGNRNAGDGGRHVEQYTFVQRRDELGAQSAINRNSDGSRDQDHRRHEALVMQRVQQRRLVDADQQPAERMLFFAADLVAVTHRGVDQAAPPLPPPVAASQTSQGQPQRRVKRDRQQRRDQHGQALGVGQRMEQPAFLPFQGQHREEGDGHDQRAQRTPAGPLPSPRSG